MADAAHQYAPGLPHRDVPVHVGTLIAAPRRFFQLVIGRVVQAIGTAIMMPLMMTTV